MGACVFADRLPKELVRLVPAHGAARMIQRCWRAVLGRRVASARRDEVLSSLALTYLFACAHEGGRPFEW